MQIKVKNLDELFSTIKSEMGKLVADGYDCKESRPRIRNAQGKEITLLGWFFENIAALKKGGTFEVAKAWETEGGSYTVYRDNLSLTTEQTSMGLLCTVERVEHNYEWNSWEQSGTTDPRNHKYVFLLILE